MPGTSPLALLVARTGLFILAPYGVARLLYESICVCVLMNDLYSYHADAIKLRPYVCVIRRKREMIASTYVIERPKRAIRP